MKETYFQLNYKNISGSNEWRRALGTYLTQEDAQKAIDSMGSRRANHFEPITKGQKVQYRIQKVVITGKTVETVHTETKII